jgi:predicted acetyltransferase/8-oxo-dGTP pyrophosphatase MutT (NUDIX family)
MKDLILRELSPDDEQAFLKSFEDWRGEDLTWLSFAWKPGMSHSEHLRHLQENKDRKYLPSNRVPSTMLYGFVNGEIVGRINIRHELNDYLLKRGGHIGYAVSPRFRKMGYATEMMRQGLSFCQSLGLEKILITCDDKNLPSCRIIEKFYGSLENRFFDQKENLFVRRYWIDFNLVQNQKNSITEKVVGYLTRSNGSKTQILVFNHDEQFSDAGTQVPAGTVESDENLEEAILREVYEEAGLENLIIESKIDHYQFYREQSKKYVRRHVFHLTSTVPLPDKWTYQVQGNGQDQGLNFHFFWMDIEKAKGILAVRFDDSIDLLIHKQSQRAIIRRACSSDSRSIHEAHMRSIQEICSKDYSQEEIAVWGNRPYNESQRLSAIESDYVWIIEIDQVVYGYAHLKFYVKESQNLAHVMGLYLTKEVQGHGYGKKLFEYILSESKGKLVTKISLESTLTAYDFYIKMGFKPDGSESTVVINGKQIRCIPMTMNL